MRRFSSLCVLLVLAIVGCGPVHDNFDNYPTGQSLHGVQGWKGWDNNPGATAFTSNIQSISPPNSVHITGSADLVHEFQGIVNGTWRFHTKQFIPSSSVGDTYFILMNRYTDGPSAPKSWSLQLECDAANNFVRFRDGVNAIGGQLPLIENCWVPIDVIIDLANDRQQVYYNKKLLFEGPWRTVGDTLAVLNLGAVDLYSDNAGSQAFYDHMYVTNQAISPLSMFQTLFNGDGNEFLNTEWGLVEVQYLGTPAVQYLNVATESNWSIQNLPLFNYEGVGRLHTVVFHIPYTTPRTGPVRFVPFGYTITPGREESPPSLTNTAFACDKWLTVYSGFRGETIGPVPIPHTTIKDFFIVKSAGHTGFPNQPCGRNECAPTALSNSLKWLKEKSGWDIPDADIGIGALKGITGWDETGCPGGIDDPAAWWKKKDDHAKANGWPIQTKTSRNLDDVMKAVEDGCDVEVRIPGHAAAIVGIGKQEDGTYDVDIADDGGQRNNPDDCRITRVKVNGETRAMTGGGWFDGRTIDYFVIECFKKEGKPNKVFTDLGELFVGTQSSCDESDDDYWSVFNDADSLGAAVGIESFTTNTAPTAILFTFEGSVARPGLAQVISMLDYDNGLYVVVQGQVATTSDSTVTTTVTSNPGRFVSDDRDMRVRISWNPINDEDPAQDGWLHNADFAEWTVN